MRLLSSDDSGSEHSDRTMILTEVVALLGRKDYQARVSAFEILYAYYQQPIERYLVMRGYEQEYACDLCQETFLRVWDCFLCLEMTLPQTIDHLKNWLYRIAKNVAIDDHRRKKPIGYLSMLESETYTVEGEEDRIIDRVWFEEEVPQLPPKQRDSLVMHLSGYREKQIAAKLRISPSAVSMNVSRGRTELHRKYFPVTVDLQRAEALHAEQVMLSILEGAIGLINNEKLEEYRVRALDWHYRQYMKKHMNELRDDLLLNNPKLQALYAREAKQLGKDCWLNLLIDESGQLPFDRDYPFGKRGRLYPILNS